MNNQLFVISRAVWETLTVKEVKATADALREVDAFKLPYPSVDIDVSTSVLQVKDNEGRPLQLQTNDMDRYFPGYSVRFLGVSLEHTMCKIALVLADGRVREACNYPYPVNIAEPLITLLATRNIGKEVKECKSAGLGIGKRKGRYRYTTTLTLPHQIPQADGDQTPKEGTSPRPHLRRGHIRRQRWGPNLERTKTLFIHPIIVNADADFVNSREAYNISQGAKI